MDLVRPRKGQRKTQNQTLHGLRVDIGVSFLMVSCSWMRGQWVSQRGRLLTTRPRW